MTNLFTALNYEQRWIFLKFSFACLLLWPWIWLQEFAQNCLQGKFGSQEQALKKPQPKHKKPGGTKQQDDCEQKTVTWLQKQTPHSCWHWNLKPETVFFGRPKPKPWSARLWRYVPWVFSWQEHLNIWMPILSPIKLSELGSLEISMLLHTTSQSFWLEHHLRESQSLSIPAVVFVASLVLVVLTVESI